MLTGVYRDIPDELLPQDEKICFNGKIGQHYPRDVQIHETEIPSGGIEIRFFPRLEPNVLFDFQNREIEGKKELIPGSK